MQLQKVDYIKRLSLIEGLIKNFKKIEWLNYLISLKGKGIQDGDTDEWKQRLDDQLH